MDTSTTSPTESSLTMTKTATKSLKKAFDAPRGSVYNFDPDDVTIIGYDTEHTAAGKEDDGTHHYLWDERILDKLDAGFVDNVRENGVESPIAVAKIDGEPVVVYGRKRTLALRLANEGGKKYVLKALVVSGTPMELRAMMIRENAQRAEMTMVAKAKEAALQAELGCTLAQIALTFGVSTKAVENWLALAGAIKPVRDAVESGEVPATAASKIARLKDPEAQREALDEVRSKGRVTTQSARAAVASTKARKNGKAEPEANGIGLTSRRDQKKLLVWLASGEQAERSVYWDGVADALKVVLGEKGADKRIKGAVKKALRAE